MLYDPNKTRARTDSVEDSLGQGLTVKPGAKEKWEVSACVRWRRKDSWSPLSSRSFTSTTRRYVDPEINRGPKKIEPPPAPSGRTSFHPVIEQDPNLKDDFGPRRRGYVKEPGMRLATRGRATCCCTQASFAPPAAKRGVVE